MVPEWLGWTDVVLSVVAFGIGLVTLPTAFQMWWGRPTIDVQFTTDRREGIVALKCFITNPPVTGWRKKLGVYRETANNLCIIYTIREGGTERLIADMERPRINIEKGESSIRVDLHSGLPGIAWILYQEAGEKIAKINAKDDKSEYPTVEPGEYECYVKIVWASGSIDKRARCMIGRTIDETHWATVRSYPPHGR